MKKRYLGLFDGPSASVPAYQFDIQGYDISRYLAPTHKRETVDPPPFAGFAFKLSPKSYASDNRTHYFACSSIHIRHNWLKTFRESIMGYYSDVDKDLSSTEEVWARPRSSSFVAASFSTNSITSVGSSKSGGSTESSSRASPSTVTTRNTNGAVATDESKSSNADKKPSKEYTNEQLTELLKTESALCAQAEEEYLVLSQNHIALQEEFEALQSQLFRERDTSRAQSRRMSVDALMAAAIREQHAESNFLDTPNDSPRDNTSGDLSGNNSPLDDDLPPPYDDLRRASTTKAFKEKEDMKRRERLSTGEPRRNSHESRDSRLSNSSSRARTPAGTVTLFPPGTVDSSDDDLIGEEDQNEQNDLDDEKIGNPVGKDLSGSNSPALIPVRTSEDGNGIVIIEPDSNADLNNDSANRNSEETLQQDGESTENNNSNGSAEEEATNETHGAENRKKSARDLRSKRVRLWVGSWNMGAKDIRKDQRKDIYQAVPTDYDVYVFGVQECVDSSIFEVIERHLNRAGKIRIPISCRVTGRGDGSFLYPKYTGIAVYISKAITRNVRLLDVAECSMGRTQGSKGGACVALQIFDTTIAFLSVHMSSRTVHDRRSNYKELVRQAGAQLGEPHFQLLEQFHHIVWFGDMNYRLSNIEPGRVLQAIYDGDLQKLRSTNHEELGREIKLGTTFYGFKEPRPGMDFLPTYKKHERRVLPTNYDDENWVNKVYKVLYKEPWYKSGKVVPRIPSFCDRILTKSVADKEGSLIPEVQVDPAFGEHDNYSALNEYLNGSDHTAIYGGFQLTCEDVIPRTMKREFMDYRVRLVYANVVTPLPRRREYIDKEELNYSSAPPRHVRVLFPGPYEDDNDALRSYQLLAKDIAKTSSQFFWRGVHLCKSLHFLMMVKTQGDESGFVVVALEREMFIKSTTVEFDEIMMYNGLPVIDSVTKRPVRVKFQLQLNQGHQA